MQIAIIGASTVGRALASSTTRAAHTVTVGAARPEHAQTAGLLGDALAGKVLVDATNRVDPADPASVLDGTSTAEHIQARAPAARVVKAFNTAFAARQANPPVDGTPGDGFVAGDDAAAKSSVLELVGSLGFRPVDAGPLVMARVLEGMALLNIAHQLRTRGAWQAGWKLLEPAAPPAGH